MEIESYPPHRNTLRSLCFVFHKCSLIFNWNDTPVSHWSLLLDFCLKMGKNIIADVFIQLDLMGIYLCICKEANTFLNMFEPSIIIRHHLYII